MYSACLYAYAESKRVSVVVIAIATDAAVIVELNTAVVLRVLRKQHNMHIHT